MPVGLLVPLDEELAAARRLRLRRVLLPSPRQDLRHLAFQWWALQAKNNHNY